MDDINEHILEGDWMEVWDLYDRNRNKLKEIHTRGKPIPKGKYHLVVHVWIQNDQGELLLSKRHPGKSYGGYWECTGGSVIAGENSLQGACREVAEELGLPLQMETAQLLQHEVRENYHLDTWLFFSNIAIEELTLQPEEVIDAKWVTKQTYQQMRERGQIVPTIHDFYALVPSKKPRYC